MGFATTLLGIVRGRSESVLDMPGGTEGPLVVNSRGDLSVVQALPRKTELARMRNSYNVITTGAVAPVAALPTTAALLSIYNGEPENGRIYIIDSAHAFTVVSAGAASGISLCAMLNVGKKTAPANALTPKGTAGQAYRGNAAILAGASGLTDDTWHPIGSSVVSNTTSFIGMAVDVPLDGQYIVPPGHYFHLSVLANTVATMTVRCGIRWHEVQLPFGS